MTGLESTVDFLNGILWGKHFLVVLLIGSGIYFSYKTGFVQVRMLPHMIGLLLEKNKKDDTNISSFQALCVSTATRVGTGNLAGVVSAVSIGGAGAVFWMWVVAIFGAATAFMETTLAIIYREKDKDGSYTGGPAFFLKNGLDRKKSGIIFVICGLICWAGVLQVVANSVTESFKVAFDIEVLYSSIFLVILSAIIVMGNKNKIVAVLDKIVPLMAVLYLGTVAFIIIKNITLVPGVIETILAEAWGIKQGIGGTIGAIIMQGVKRGLFSNEAGTGSAPCAAAAAEVSHPVKQGLIQSFGVFIDTLLICTATALVVLITDSNIIKGINGMELLQVAFNFHIGFIGKYFVAIILFLFSFSTLLGICFYGRVNVIYLSNKEWAQNMFKIFALIMVFIGGMSQNIFMWNLADLGLGLMTIVNMSGVYPLASIALASLADYERLIKKDIS